MQINFTYESDPSKNCLTDASMHFPAKKMTFMIGESGSGKSTVCSLIANLLTPADGQVTIDGHPVHQLQNSCLRRHVALIQQQSPVIHDTFFNNVALGHNFPSEVTMSDVLRACEFAQLDSAILSLRNGVSTVISADAQLLSGGQRQRLALARAKLRDPEVLILDEPTSALDPASQITIMKAIRKWRHGKTTIIVTHDLSNIEDQDFVYILKNGSVFCHGRMNQLRNIAEACCNAEDGRRTNSRHFSNSSVSNSSFGPRATSQLSPAHVHDHLQESQRNTLLVASPPWSRGYHDSSTQNFEKNTRKRLSRPVSVGWQLASDAESKQKQFSNYVESRFAMSVAAGGAPTSKLQLGLVKEESRDTVRRQNAVDAESSTSLGHECRENTTNSMVKSADGGRDLFDRRVRSLLGIINTVWWAVPGRDCFTLIVAIILCLIAASATPAFSYCLAQLLAAMWAEAGKEVGVKWALYLVGIAAIDGLCTGVGHYLFEKVGQTWVDNLRKTALRNILEQPNRWSQGIDETGRHLGQCLDRNAEEMRAIIGKILPVIIVVLAIMFISVVWAMAICWKLTLVALSPLPLIIVMVKAHSMVSSKWEQRCNMAAANISAILREMLINFEFVRVLSLESYFNDRQFSAAGHCLRTGLQRSLYTGPLFGLYQSIVMPLAALVFYYGTSIAAEDTSANVGKVLQVINLLLFSIGTAFELLNGLPELPCSKEAAAELLAYVRLPRVAQQPLKTVTDQPSSLLPIRIRNLDYVPDRFSPKLLNMLCLEIEQGRSLAIAGASGSGKSTLLSILLGINAPSNLAPGQFKDQNFCLTFGDASNTAMDVRHLRSMMAYVPQKPFLFPATIGENIAYGIDASSTQSLKDTVIQAAKISGIHDFIESLPNAYDTIVGDGGQMLSGGQAQLVNVARALARKPQLLVLDEPTSALDEKSVAAVRSAITSLIRLSCKQQSTMAIVVATHCPKMMQAVDEILVLDAGSKVEQGPYETLVANRGPLWKLVDHDRK